MPERQPRGRDGVPRRRRDPELLGLRPELRPAGSPLRAERRLELALPSVHGLGVVGPLLEPRRPDELPDLPWGGPQLLPRTANPLRVDGPHLAARPSRGQLG